jgi:CGA synthase-related protein
VRTPQKNRPKPSAPATPRRRVLFTARDEELDSTLALRRVRPHLSELRPVGHGLPDAALVCDDPAAANRLLGAGVPVVHLRSGHDVTAHVPVPPGALCRVHRPGWLPGPWAGGVPATGALAPMRLTRNRVREGALLLLSVWDVPGAEVEAFAGGLLRCLAVQAVRRTGRCEVVCDTRLAQVRAELDGIQGVRISRAAETDVDTLHARAEVFLAAPTLGVLALARARRAPLALLPPLGAAQRDLAERVARAIDVPVATDPGDPALWLPRDPWHTLDPAADDLRGAQRIARTLRQLCLAPP